MASPDPLCGYGTGAVPTYLAMWAEVARKATTEEDVPNLDEIARAVGIPELSARDIPGIQERKNGYEVWYGKTEEGKRKRIGTFPSLHEAMRAREIAADEAADIDKLLV